MKKVLCFMAIIALLLSSVGCGNEKEDESLGNFEPAQDSVLANINNIIESGKNEGLSAEETQKAIAIFLSDFSEEQDFTFTASKNLGIIEIKSQTGKNTHYQEKIVHQIDYGYRATEYSIVCEEDISLFNEENIIKCFKSFIGIDLNTTDFVKASQRLKESAKNKDEAIIESYSIYKKDNMEIMISLAQDNEETGMVIICKYMHS